MTNTEPDCTVGNRCGVCHNCYHGYNGYEGTKAANEYVARQRETEESKQ